MSSPHTQPWQEQPPLWGLQDVTHTSLNTKHKLVQGQMSAAGGAVADLGHLAGGGHFIHHEDMANSWPSTSLATMHSRRCPHVPSKEVHAHRVQGNQQTVCRDG